MDALPNPAALGETWCHLIEQQYGDRLTPEALAEVREGVAELLTTVAALRAVPLDNSIAPGLVFVPYRPEE